ncbi:lipopolysaccharide assembly protein LapB [Bacteroides sp. 519]|uniref:tetratricopeptide repeat protein n=1 Tax=Bacteroides sp. 519 TaxID=2302937 RepID=UPI0013D65B0C|nr:hypothetical protein [Bacteroides sp. 519]NDV57079.1 hypothetical protein [Bacteroides sp. 519]
MIGLVSLVVSVVAILFIYFIRKPEIFEEKSPWIWKNIGKPIFNYLFVISVRKVTLAFLGVIATICAGWPITKLTVGLSKEDKDSGLWTALEFEYGALDWFVVSLVVLIVLMYALYMRYEGKLLNPSSEQLREISDTTERTDKKLDVVLKRMTNKDTIDIVKELAPAINSLHVNTAYRLLEKLRVVVTKESYPDLPLLATIDYFMGNCKRYVDSKKALEHYEIAYQAAERANYFDCDIVAGQIYVYCKNRNKDKALELAESIKLRDSNNVWVWVPTLVFAIDINESLQNVPENVKSGDNLIAIVSMLDNDIFKEMPVNPDTHPIKILDNLTIDNIPVWVFYLSISLTRFLKQWVYKPAGINNTPFKESEDLYAMSEKYYELLHKTELNDVLPDLRFTHALVAYIHDNSISWINEIKNCTYTPGQKDFYYLAVASMLMSANREPEAITFLAAYGADVSASVLQQRFSLALKAQNSDDFMAIFQDACQYNVAFDDDNLNYVLSSIQYFTEVASPHISQLNIVNVVTKNVVLEILAFFEGKQIDIEYIKIHEGELHDILKPYVSLIYEKYIGIDDAIRVIEPIVDMNYYDIRTHVYVQLLRKDKKNGSKLYDFCKQLRLNKIETSDTLNIELGMAESLQDFERALQITTLCIDKNPKNGILIEHHLMALYRCKKYDDVEKFFDRLKDVDFPETAISNITNTYHFINRPDLAVEFLYQQIHRNPTQPLHDLFYQFSVQKSLGDIIHQQYDVVTLNSYVMLDVDGQEQYDDILLGSYLEDLVGKHPGETIELHHFRRISIVTVKAIFNKYHKLWMDCMKEISENRSKTIKSFTIDDLTGGDGIFANLKELSGQRDGYVSEMEEAKINYQNGSITLYNFIGEHQIMSDLYDKLFGDFTICMIPRKVVAQHIAACNYNMKDVQPVLELSSLLMMHEIHKQFNLSFTKRFILAKSIAVAIDDSIMKELKGMPTFFSQKLYDILVIEQHEEEPEISPLVAKLKMVKQWIADYCDIENCEEILNQDLSKIGTQLQRMFLESTMIANQPNRILITEDWTISMINFNAYKAVSCNNWLYFMDYEEMEKIDVFFADLNYFGCEMTAEYICDQYHKNSRKEPNHLQNCYLNIEKNKLNTYNVLNAGLRLLDGITEPGVNIFTMNLFSLMFKNMNYTQAQRVLSMAFRISNDTVYRQCLVDAYKITHPLIM